jgi:hypothetical protein
MYCSANCSANSELTQKRRVRTNRKTYGADYALQTTKIKERQKQTLIERYGTTSVSSLPDVIARKRKKYYEKHGVYHPSQRPEVRERQIKGSFKKHKVKVNGETAYLQGFEPQALEYIKSKGIKESEIVVGKDVPTFKYKNLEGRNSVYFPDFYIPKLNAIIEVKSTLTLLKWEKQFEVTKAKAKKVIAKGYDFRLLLMSPKGDRLPLPKTWLNMTREQVTSQVG